MFARRLRANLRHSPVRDELPQCGTNQPHKISISTSSISISHSGDWCACAVAKASVVGVDVETIKPRNWDANCKDIFIQKNLNGY